MVSSEVYRKVEKMSQDGLWELMVENLSERKHNKDPVGSILNLSNTKFLKFYLF